MFEYELHTAQLGEGYECCSVESDLYCAHFLFLLVSFRHTDVLLWFSAFVVPIKNVVLFNLVCCTEWWSP